MLNTERVELRRAARVATGIHEAFGTVLSLPFLEALTVNPQEAKAQHERQSAEAELEKAKNANMEGMETESWSM